MYDWDIASDAISWGINAPEVFGVADIADLGTGKGFELAIEPDSGPTRHEAILTTDGKDLGSGVPYRTRYAIRLPGGSVVLAEDTGRWYADAEGRPAFAHGVVRVDRTGAADPSGIGARARQRSVFVDQIASDVANAGRGKPPLTLLVASVADLGRLNDELGYEGADEVVQEVIRRIRSVMRRRDHFSTYAGNRFAVALLSCSAEQAVQAAARIAHVVESAAVATQKGPRLVRLWIGAAVAPDHAGEASLLLRRAEEALGCAKRGFGQGSSMLYDPSAAAKSAHIARGTAPLDIVEALNARRVTFARQPVIDARTREPVFSEALARIRGADGRIISAGDILPAVERAGLVPLVDSRILELAADYLAAHPAERLSINVSPLTIERGDWLTMLAAHLGARPGIAARLVIEITETAAVRDPLATRGRLDAMKALGVAIAIDDFGAGHTSFKHLRSFPVDILKIDGAFVQNLARSPDDRFFVRTLVDLAHHLNITTVAEWVEDEATARLLAEWGIDYLQGDWCGPPVLAEDTEIKAFRVA